MRKFLFLLLALPCLAQQFQSGPSLTQTMLSAALTSSSQNVYVASATGISAYGSSTTYAGSASSDIYIDRELMRVTAINGKVLTVIRGFGGTASVSHASGATVYAGNPDWFHAVDANGSCSGALAVPYVNVSDGYQFSCVSGQWQNNTAVNPSGSYNITGAWTFNGGGTVNIGVSGTTGMWANFPALPAPLSSDNYIQRWYTSFCSCTTNAADPVAFIHQSGVFMTGAAETVSGFKYHSGQSDFLWAAGSADPTMIAVWNDTGGPGIEIRDNPFPGAGNYILAGMSGGTTAISGGYGTNGNYVFSIEDTGATKYGTGTRASMQDMGGLVDLTATAGLTAGQVVKLDSANASSVVVAATTDTGGGIAIGIVVNSPLAAGTATVLTNGVTALPLLGTGTCAIGNFVIVDTTTAGDVKCTATYTAGTVIGKALTAQTTVGQAVTVLVQPR